MMSVDRHHLLFERHMYSQNRNLILLREECGLIARMDRECHNDIHDAITCVPPPNRYMAQIVLSMMMNIEDKSDPLVMADNYMFAIQESCKNSHTNDLDRALGQLIINSVYYQKPFIRDGVTRAQVIDLDGLRFKGQNGAA